MWDQTRHDSLTVFYPCWLMKLSTKVHESYLDYFTIRIWSSSLTSADLVAAFSLGTKSMVFPMRHALFLNCRMRFMVSMHYWWNWRQPIWCGPFPGAKCLMPCIKLHCDHDVLKHGLIAWMSIDSCPALLRQKHSEWICLCQIYLLRYLWWPRSLAQPY